MTINTLLNTEKKITLSLEKRNFNRGFNFPSKQENGLQSELPYEKAFNNYTYGFIEIIPNKTVRVFLKDYVDNIVFDKTYDLTIIETMFVLMDLSEQINRFRKTAYYELPFDDFEFLDFLDSEKQDLLQDFADFKSEFIIFCYPNLLKTETIMDYTKIIRTQEQIDALLDLSLSPFEITKSIFPMINKASIGGFKKIFSLGENKPENTLFVSRDFFTIFKSPDKLAILASHLEHKYMELFKGNDFFGGQSIDFNSDLKYTDFLTVFNRLLPKKEHAFEDIILRSIDPVMINLYDNWNNIDMGDEIEPNFFDFFFGLQTLMSECMHTKMNISMMIMGVNSEDEKGIKAEYIYERFMKKYRIKSVPELHDDLTELNAQIHHCLFGDTAFGDNEDIPVEMKYNYSEEKIAFYSANEGSFDIKLASSGSDLVFLGNVLSICVGGYHNIIKEDENHLILAVFKKNVPYFCIEVSNNTIIQAKKKNNRILSKFKEDDAVLLKFLKEYVLERNMQVDTPDLPSLKYLH